PFLVDHGDELRGELEDEELGVAAEAAMSAMLPQGAAPALPSPFVRPLRVRHRGAVLDVPLCEAEGIAAGQARAVSVAGGYWHVQVGTVDLFVADASFEPPESDDAGSGSVEMRAPFNGKVVAVHAAGGELVMKGQSLLVIESMKLEHSLVAPRDAVIRTVHVDAGQQVAPPRVLITFEPA
ncbi:MAG: biotin/lipoyl-binding protein, partial [Ramlibacter sp.]|nr:biotin/lipoyl-binding protein [Ramlibacter sp.]